MEAATTIITPYNSPAQIPGLKVRFLPFGASPLRVTTKSPKIKRKVESAIETTADTTADSPKKKKKKKKKKSDE
jgi:hypothetical protein